MLPVVKIDNSQEQQEQRNAVCTWFWGLVAAVVTGGSSAARASLAAGIVLPDVINLAHPAVAMKLAAWAFAIKGVMIGLDYLKANPTPKFVFKNTKVSSPDGSSTETASLSVVAADPEAKPPAAV